MKKAILLFLLLGFFSVARAANVTVLGPVDDQAAYIQPYTLFTSEAVAGNGGTASSSAVDLGKALYFGLWVKCAGSAPDVKLEWFESPTKESTDFALGVNVASSHTGTSAANYGISAIPMRYGRLKVTGNTGNGANTTCSVKIAIWGMR